MKHFKNTKCLIFSALGVLACSGAFRGVSVCLGGVWVVFKLCLGIVLVFQNLRTLYETEQFTCYSTTIPLSNVKTFVTLSGISCW